ncbi:ribonuclease HII [Paludicola sp. MB14-C6]|uniref:ribonuclease HII n=1 Tax=Paludihabitans sp. MB14-C6 TaxID=3070656 RepID=UPI0027DDEAC7|nr:ribonuclease HII [Paludicola sp. MB14-C6]WMJ23942.1 ribonuclease HII [Paludicola sp. MB14-C6]
MDIFEYDKQEGVELLCGVDEAGRGPLAGDVYAAAVILPQGFVLEGLNDSKKLTEKKRDLLYDAIIENAVSYCIATASVKEIEELNILNATFLAMRRAVEGLNVQPKLVLVDGNQNPKLSVHTRCVVKGDATSACIAASSILAKVARDRYMKQVAYDYPQYQFEKHKGYGTALHYQMLDEFGVSDVHRPSFLKKYLSGKQNKTQLKGALGEQTTADYLVANGYEIVAKNYHSAYGEIDIIAQKENILAFVEVKTRKEKGLATAREAVSRSKQTKIINTALMYLQENGLKKQPRFDVCEIYLDSDTGTIVTEVNYIKNAFTGDGRNAYI